MTSASCLVRYQFHIRDTRSVSRSSIQSISPAHASTTSHKLLKRRVYVLARSIFEYEQSGVSILQLPIENSLNIMIHIKISHLLLGKIRQILRKHAPALFRLQKNISRSSATMPRIYQSSESGPSSGRRTQTPTWSNGSTSSPCTTIIILLYCCSGTAREDNNEIGINSAPRRTRNGVAIVLGYRCGYHF